jgi:dGTPase
MKSIDRNLAPYATKNSASTGRVHDEVLVSARLPYERDRDRIIHSNAFRRLAGKTQVFVAGTGDHFRTRLTHSIEVAQIARSLARALKLNEDLAEAIALAHDLGHPPFAHSGQDVLDALMRKYGDRFEHNEQSRRIVEFLEVRYPYFPGLNLTHETLAGLKKHETPWDNPYEKAPTIPPIEGQLVDIADEVAYFAHDLDDGLRADFFPLDFIRRRDLVMRAMKEGTEDILPTANSRARHQTVRITIGFLVRSIIKETERRIEKNAIRDASDVSTCKHPLVGFPKKLEKGRAQMRRMLYRRFYTSARLARERRRGQRMITMLFTRLIEHPRRLPAFYRARIDALDPIHVVVKDYIAGMTDQFAEKEYNRIVKK